MRTTLRYAGWALAALVASSQLPLIRRRGTRPRRPRAPEGPQAGRGPLDPLGPAAGDRRVVPHPARRHTSGTCANKWLGDPTSGRRSGTRTATSSIATGSTRRPLAVPESPTWFLGGPRRPTSEAQPPARRSGSGNCSRCSAGGDRGQPSAPATPAMIQLARRARPLLLEAGLTAVMSLRRSHGRGKQSSKDHAGGGGHRLSQPGPEPGRCRRSRGTWSCGAITR